MLFIHPEYRGKKIGKALLKYAIDTLHVTKVDVNEQNEQAEQAEPLPKLTDTAKTPPKKTRKKSKKSEQKLLFEIQHQQLFDNLDVL